MINPHAPDVTPRSGPEERQYLLRRAEDHRQLAEKTDDVGSQAIHLRLHRLYRERAALSPYYLPGE
ncbi:hypothetical protein [Sphingomonas glacialis]|uniref:hypothetical protein n=1 Tax=Sphingomonas glacialis TaxID=658225 RepID=UPI00112A3CB3|nr:hypothetical protein [Sphingomonas glacialis]